MISFLKKLFSRDPNNCPFCNANKKYIENIVTSMQIGLGKDAKVFENLPCKYCHKCDNLIITEEANKIIDKDDLNG